MEGGAGQAYRVWTPAIASLHPNVTRYVTPGWYYNGGDASTAVVANKLYYIPIFVADSHIYASIAIRVYTAGAAGTLARLGAYTWAQGLPGRLIIDSGTVSTATSGNKEITANIALPGPGMHFLTVISDGVPILLGPDPVTAIFAPVSGIGGSVAQVLDKLVLSVANQTTAVANGLPDPAPAPTATEVSAFANVRLAE